MQQNAPGLVVTPEQTVSLHHGVGMLVGQLGALEFVELVGSGILDGMCRRPAPFSTSRGADRMRRTRGDSWGYQHGYAVCDSRRHRATKPVQLRDDGHHADHHDRRSDSGTDRGLLDRIADEVAMHTSSVSEPANVAA